MRIPSYSSIYTLNICRLCFYDTFVVCSMARRASSRTWLIQRRCGCQKLTRVNLAHLEFSKGVHAHAFGVQQELKCGCYGCGLHPAGCPSAVDATIFIRAAWFRIWRCLSNLLWCCGLLVMLHDHQLICWVPNSEGKRRSHLQEPCYSGTLYLSLALLKFHRCWPDSFLHLH